MASERRVVQLGDVVNLLTGFPFKSQFYTESPADPRLLGGDNIVQGSLRWEKVRRWPLAMTDGLDQYWLHEGDVVLAMDRPWIEAGLKRAAVGPHDLPALLVQRTARLRGTDELDTKFLRFLIGSREFTQHILAVQTGTAVPHISPSQIKEFQFALPPLEEQRTIAEVLGTIDDKIEFNRRMNQTLEAMAQTLFRSWFVDFDPVRAKAEGRQPNGMDAETAAQFPSRFVDSKQGKIPEEWEVHNWSELVSLEYGKALRHYSEGSVPVYGTNGRIGFHSTPLCAHAGVIVGRKGAYRGIHYSPVPFFVIDTAFYVEPCAPLEMRWVYYELLREGVNSMDSGSAIPSTSRSDFYALKTIVPPHAIQSRFVDLLEPMWRRQQANDQESRTLANLRDSLLPKLLSGELRVRGAEAQLAAIACS
ncbi:restriction endonuclease subunit S [Corallococcus aberystwythensis]|uniref:Restriction endonuclease subunit S n=1 Tax=Corallococcus aberystwythensis TaxID=2316722 RepID=A0A3A8QB92_9BACT|nr:restriction endonuclease subunit S [Corallococcus aberystwythensis]RKH60524.1 restriction endonuclease subunit S [Corallococcus aberystwythensis]